MQIGMRIPPMGREMGIDGVINWAGENGFDAIDLPGVDRNLRKACGAAGLKIGSVDWGVGGDLLSRDGAKRRKAVTAVKKVIRDTAAHGSGVVFVVLMPDDPLQPRTDSFDIMKRVYPGIVSYAEKQGVSLAIEPYPGGAPGYANLGCTPETLRAIFEVIPSPALGICYDPSHFARIGVNYRRLLIEFADRVRHVHAKDTEILEDGVYEYGYLGQTFGSRYRYGEGWWRYCIPGWGIVDWKWVVARLEESGYEGLFSIELEDHRYTGRTELNQRGLLASKFYLRAI